MKRGALSELSCITIEGGALSTSVVQTLMARKLESADAASYHIEEGYTLNEKIAEEWNRVRASWKNLQKERDRLGVEPGASLTRDKFLLPLFDRLGYGRLAYTGSLEAGGERYSITHQWGDVPIHLVGMDTDLDSRTSGRSGAARRSPHGLVLEYLNKTEANPWGFVSNGKRLRLLRENRSIVRQSYLEFDLEGIIEGDYYADFTALWMLCHQSRVEGKGEAHILEHWRELGIKEGERALDELRVGMEGAISCLGKGFLAHPANVALHEALRKGKAKGGLDTEDFYHELLRLAYRLIFLFVAEDREVLLDPKAGIEVQRRYAKHYSTRRLRELARSIRGGGHGDLWRGFVTVMDFLAESGCAELGLPALGSFLWERESIAHLVPCELSNRDFLGALRDLAFTRRNEALWPTDFRNLGSEELGSVYESLLELHAELNIDGGAFQLTTAAGHERKTTGSYYTPTELVEGLLDEALDPVIARALAERVSEAAILSLKVCDPAMGSGHFLAGAARRLAKALASVRTGDPEPGPEPLRHAMADVIQHCIYGVDLNPLAVELCKISLWMEALEPGRPLSFLDHHLKCGNSLVGTTRELMKKGIPEGAFTELTGDDKVVIKAAKKRNSEYSRYDGGLFGNDELFPDYGKIADRFGKLEDLDETTLEGVRLLAARYRSIVETPEYLAELSAANGWCATFFQAKRPGQPEPITQEQFSVWLRDPSKVSKVHRDLAEDLAAAARFFHWELAFPEVFGTSGEKDSGFDVVLGNPPWERIKLQEVEWFAEKNPEIAQSPAAQRKRAIESLKTIHDPLFDEYQDALRISEAESLFLRKSCRYPLCGKGDVNLYSIFAELAYGLISKHGMLGMILPSGIATDDTTKEFFSTLSKNQRLKSFYEFENIGFFDAGKGHMLRFALTTIGGDGFIFPKARFVFQAQAISEIDDEQRIVELKQTDFKKYNPNTETAPIFFNKRDYRIVDNVYSRVPILVRDKDPPSNPWNISIFSMFHMTNDEHLFRTFPELMTDGYHLVGNYFVRGTSIWLPLYEAKLMFQFNHRYGDHRSLGHYRKAHILPETSDIDLKNTSYEILPHYWINEESVAHELELKWKCKWFLGFRAIADSRASARSMIATIIPFSGVGNNLPLILMKEPTLSCLLLANLSSLIMDFVVRSKLPGNNLNFFIFKQFAVLPPGIFDTVLPWGNDASTIAEWIKPRVIELVYTSHSLDSFSRDLGYSGAPFTWDPVRRFALRCELDAAFFHLYGISREDVDYIMDTFPIVKRQDVEEYGEYRTKRVVLERYDEYALAMRKNGISRIELGNYTTPKAPGDGLPALPEHLTVASLITYLEQLGVKVENNRAKGGGIWVYLDKQKFGAVAKRLEVAGVGLRYYPNGRSKQLGEQWEIDPGKMLS